MRPSLKTWLVTQPSPASRVSHGVGFELMVAAGLHDMAAEWIVLESRHLFGADVLARAEQKLAAAGVVDRPGLLPQAA